MVLFTWVLGRLGLEIPIDPWRRGLNPVSKTIDANSNYFFIDHPYLRQIGVLNRTCATQIYSKRCLKDSLCSGTLTWLLSVIERDLTPCLGQLNRSSTTHVSRTHFKEMGVFVWVSPQFFLGINFGIRLGVQLLVQKI